MITTTIGTTATSEDPTPDPDKDPVPDMDMEADPDPEIVHLTIKSAQLSHKAAQLSNHFSLHKVYSNSQLYCATITIATMADP